MQELDIYKNFYQISEDEEKCLKDIWKNIKDNIDSIFFELLLFYKNQEELKIFFKKTNFEENLKTNFYKWLEKMLKGPYNQNYVRFLKKIGIQHARNNLPAHYINVGFGIVRRKITSILRENVESLEQRIFMINALNKILDFNLDVINSTARKTELEDKFLKVKVENKLLNFASNFSHFLNILLVCFLVIISLAVLFFFFKDFSYFFQGHYEKGIITALGTMLIVWMMIELMEVEIENLKTRKIQTKIFISVVIVAFVRKILIATFEHPSVEKQIFMVGTTLALAIVYFLLSKSD